MTEEKRLRMASLLMKGLSVDKLSELTTLLLEERYEWHQQQLKILNIPVVRLSFSDEKFRELFNELINAGRDMQIRDNLGNSYMSEEMYFKDVKARYSNEAQRSVHGAF